MALPSDGRYRLRYVPNPDEELVGGLLATELQGRDHPINAAPEGPGFQGRQTWEVKRAGEGEVHIHYVPRGPEDDFGGIGFHYDEDRPHVPIIFSFVSKFSLEHINGNTWRIRPVGGWVGTDLVVGLSGDNTLLINPYPLDSTSRPAWHFELLLE
ncbi:hypothetical protein OPQ81_003132 [Rhizoctonia solani]|nr:hypothetical protein OPQ81_003132 [Rhizoctonia solani]